jgi:Ribbon-helix-helix domain
MKRTTIMLTEPQIKALKAASKRTGIKIAELIRRFIDEGLSRTRP